MRPRIPGSDPIYTPERFEAYINVLVPRTHKGEVAKDEIVYGPDIPPAKQGRERRGPLGGGPMCQAAPD